MGIHILRGKILKSFIIFKNFLVNHWPECIDIWYGASFGQGDLNVFKWSPYCHVWLGPRGL